MRVLKEVRKEDDLYYEGPFWLVGDSFKDILKGNFKLVGEKYACDYNGTTLDTTPIKDRTHKRVWDKLKKDNLSYTYYPRGRVNIVKGIPYIALHSKCNMPKIIDTIYKEYNLKKLGHDVLELTFNDEYGDHYNFELE